VLGIPKVMIFLLIVLSTLMYWTSSNVCKYNFIIEKKTNELNILLSEIDPSIRMAKVYYFKELNCNTVDLSWDFERIINILLSEIDPSIRMTKVYYFKELNCNTVDLSWDFERIIENFKVLSTLIYQEFTSDILGNPN